MNMFAFININITITTLHNSTCSMFIWRVREVLSFSVSFILCILAHLSTKCSGWAIVTGLCPSSCVVRRPSCVVRQLFYLNILSSETAHWILTTLHWNGPLPKFFKNLLVLNYKAQSFHIWYISSSRGPLPKLFKLCPCGQNWPRPGGHNFTLNYIKKNSNDIFSWTANGNVTKLNRNGPWVAFYQNCSNSSDWLHK